MQVILLTDEKREKEIFASAQVPDNMIIIRDIEEIRQHQADACIDLLFEEKDHRTPLQQFGGDVLVSSVTGVSSELPDHWTRINGWPGMLRGGKMEAVCGESRREKISEIIGRLHKTAVWVPDQPGMVAPRVISMIINEAYLALAEGVSSREEINTAMKLGTNYPFGPFEWAALIGIEKVHQLLTELSRQKPSYQPAQNMLA